jgi:hypothetical protein
VYREGNERLHTLRRRGCLVSHERELRRQDTDHRERPPLQAHIAADDGGVGPEPVPQVMRQHDHLLAPRAHFVGRKTTAERRRNAEQIEQVRRRPRHGDLHWIGALPQREDSAEELLQACGALDDGVRRLQFGDIGAAQGTALEIGDRTVVPPDVVEVARVSVGHRIEQNLLHSGVDQREHASPMLSVPMVVAGKIGERTSRRLTSSTSRPQLPARRHQAAGRIRSAAPLRSESTSARSQSTTSPNGPPLWSLSRARPCTPRRPDCPFHRESLADRDAAGAGTSARTCGACDRASRDLLRAAFHEFGDAQGRRGARAARREEREQ